MGKYLIIVPLLAGLWKPIAITERTYVPAPREQAKQVLGEIIYANFGSRARTMTAIFRAESGLNPKAVNYNCMYGGKGKPCKPHDRPKAFSIDCGVAQINVRDRECPSELMEPETNIRKAREIYERQGLRAWSTFNNGSYEKFL